MQGDERPGRVEPVVAVGEVSAHRRGVPHPHVAHLAVGLGQHRLVLAHQRRQFDVAVADQRAQPQPHAGLVANLIEPRHGLQVDQVGRLVDSLAEHDQQRRAAGDQARLVGVLLEQAHGLVERGRLQQVEPLDGHGRASSLPFTHWANSLPICVAFWRKTGSPRVPSLPQSDTSAR